MRVLVASNCQSEGLARALYRRASLTRVRASPLVLDESYERFRHRLLPGLHEWDAIVAGVGMAEQYVRRLLDETGRRPRVLVIPEMVFDAFHPDMGYATVRATGKLFDPAYHSAIAVWLFNRSIPPAIGARAYAEPVYRALGYLDRWDGAVAELRRRFEATDLAPDFPEFFLAIRRLGCFMHTLNHPRAAVLEKLAELSARALGLPLSSPLTAGDLPDGLGWEIWPVYPEIGDVLGVRGSYRWFSEPRKWQFDGVERFLDLAFRAYLAQGVRPGGLLSRDLPLEDFDDRMRVMTREVF